jgi:hypothetical protein
MKCATYRNADRAAGQAIPRASVKPATRRHAALAPVLVLQICSDMLGCPIAFDDQSVNVLHNYDGCAAKAAICSVH